MYIHGYIGIIIVASNRREKKQVTKSLSTTFTGSFVSTSGRFPVVLFDKSSHELYICVCVYVCAEVFTMTFPAFALTSTSINVCLSETLTKHSLTYNFSRFLSKLRQYKYHLSTVDCFITSRETGDWIPLCSSGTPVDSSLPKNAFDYFQRLLYWIYK